ncbi:hypothetical protein AB205_0146550 [Aquarana catesbeiana]|uniref:MADF domain-containing protein n=2 Tax=Aquarana catesbeiana TaxID=8400 RepID=A0A2G9QGE6_AQUCT|nr:hypothetical protein AB205_0146550 [Aquarana catesbeiana]
MDILNDTDFMAIFSDMFRELPCLWEINHPHYKNQTTRKAALDQLFEIVKQVIPTADMTYLKILIGGLRSTYLRECKKVQDSQRSGAADDIYVPRMWYYDRLHFLAGQTEPRSSLSSLPSTLPSPPAEASDAQPGPSRQQHVEEPSLSQGSLIQEVAGPSRLSDMQVPPLHLQRESGRKRSTLEEAAIGHFWKATEALSYSSSCHISKSRATAGNEAWKEDQKAMTLDPVWSAKRCSLLWYHSLGTQMSSAAFRISGTSGPDCTPLHMDSSGHQF